MIDFLSLFYFMHLKPLFWRGAHGRRKKKELRYWKSQIKAHVSDGCSFPLTLIRWASSPQWRNGTTEKVNIDEQKRRERSAAEDRAGGWQSSAPWKDRLQKEKTRGSVTTTNKQRNDNSLLAASDFGLRDESTKTWVFVKNTDSQALDWAWGSVLLTSIPGDLGIKHK